MSGKMNRIREALYVAVYTLLLYPAVFKFGNLFFVDLRFQTTVPSETAGWTAVAAAAGLSLLAGVAGLEAVKRSGGSLRTAAMANLPVAGCAVMWFLAPSFPLLIFNIVLAAWSVGRTAAVANCCNIRQMTDRHAVMILTLAVLLFSAVGAYQQCRSFNMLAMSWFDWGHFYECLNNFFHGKPFHLNLCDGSFLGSRFTPSLILLLPVVAVHSLPLFFFTGSLLVCSGAFFVYLIAKFWKMTSGEALLWGIWYLFIPGVANMNLSLREGFHEVFLLFPLVPAAIWCALSKKYAILAVLVILISGVRETAGILVAGYGIVLFFSKEKKAGCILFLTGILYVIAAMKLLMPLFDPPVAGTYAHVGFYSHLGNDVVEIALSPILKPAAFWGAIFNTHTLIFWITLILPFGVFAFKKPLLLIPALPELVMVSVDRRFDSQTVLRHYQISIVLVLIIALLYGAKTVRNSGKIKYLFAGLNNSGHYRGAVAFVIAATTLSFVFFVRYPGLPASDPQRRSLNNGNITRLEDATGAIARFKSHIPAGSKVTAGPMFASALIPDYDIYFKFEENEKTLQDYVLIENFSSFYFPEDQLSRYLLKSPMWQLIHQEFVDQRSFQLFKRSGNIVNKKSPLFKIPENVWQRAGHPVPLPVSDLELRAVPTGAGKLQIGVRIKAGRSVDAGFKTIISFSDGTSLEHFNSFGNGRYPADLAEPGEAFFYVITYPAGKKITACRIDVMDLKSRTTPL